MLSNGDFETISNWELAESVNPWRPMELSFALVGYGYHFFSPQRDISLRQVQGCL